MTLAPVHMSSMLTLLSGEQGILRHIFEYDNTYHEKLKKALPLSLWQKTWERWYNQVDCPYEKVVIEHLLDSWGVWDNNMYESSWYSRNYFPDGISMHAVLDHKNEMQVRAYMKFCGRMLCIFDGKVLTQKQYKQDCLEETGSEMMYIDVHEDVETGFVAFVHLN